MAIDGEENSVGRSVGVFVSWGCVGWGVGFFGRITGEVTVTGPVFYAGGGYTLFINSLDSEGCDWCEIQEDDCRTFETEEFDTSINFYNPLLNLSIEANLTEGTPNKSVNLEFGYFDEKDNGIYSEICDVTLDVTEQNYKVYWGDCVYNGVEPIEDLRGFYYRICGKNTGSVKVKVKTRGETKVEVLGVA